MTDRHAVASGEDEREHDENRMRDIHIGKRGSETAHEEQPDELRKTVLNLESNFGSVKLEKRDG